MRFVSRLLSEGYLRITGQFDFVRHTPPVDESHATHFGIVLWTYYYLHVGFDIAVSPENSALSRLIRALYS